MKHDIAFLKISKYESQNGLCAYCGQPLGTIFETQLAHILPQRKWIIKKYGEDIIHHPLNMGLTHPTDICNSGLQISPNKTELVNKHVNIIMEAIESE